MSYYVHTHKTNKIANKDLFRLNKISYEEMLENLIILLDGEKHESTATVANLPSNDDVLKSMSLQSTPAVVTASTPTDLVDTMCVVVWDDDRGDSYSWYLGYIKKYHGDGIYEIDHLTRSLKTSDKKWKYPSSPDIQLAHFEQIVPSIDIEGQWDIEISRKRIYNLENHKAISFACKNHISHL